MFYTEGNKQAMLVTHTPRGRRVRTARHSTAEAALQWCRSHRAAFVYTPALDLSGN